MTGTLAPRRIRALGAAAALLLFSGCILRYSKTRTGALIPDERLSAIQDGVSTRAEVLEAFGPPLVVVRAEHRVVRLPEVRDRRFGAIEVPAETFLAPVGGSAALGPQDVVYYYQEHELLTIGSGRDIHSFMGDSTTHEADDRLWIVLDRGSGHVKAHAHRREAGSQVVPGTQLRPELAPTSARRNGR